MRLKRERIPSSISSQLNRNMKNFNWKTHKSALVSTLKFAVLLRRLFYCLLFRIFKFAGVCIREEM